MRWNEVIKRLKKIKFTPGYRTRHFTIWNCPCPNMNHPVGVGNHGSEEARFGGFKKQLGPHLDEFGKY